MKVEKLKYPSLNGLRAISVILVIFNHLSIKEGIFTGKFFSEFIWLRPFTYFLEDGHLGVNVFFVISGFLITSLLKEEEIQTKTISLKNFYLRRILRIFPAYYFLLLVYFILQLFNIVDISNASWFTAITYTKYFNWRLDWITAHAWSLSIEEHFYIFWPLIFIGGINFRKKLLILLIIIVPIVRVYLSFYPVDWIDELSIFTRIDAIATGCIFAFYKDKILEKLKKHWIMFFYISILCLLLLSYFSIKENTIYLQFIFIPFGYTHGTIANFMIGIIIMYSVFGPQKMWFKFLNLKWLNYIGLLSYSIYLWQQIFISEEDSWLTIFPQNILFLFLMTLFSYYVIEKPFLKLKSKFSVVSLK